MDPQPVSVQSEHGVDLCRRNAVHALKLAWTTHPHVRFGHAGVRWLDNYILTHREGLDPDCVDDFVHVLGSYYGECIIAAFGGFWDFSGSKPGIRTEGVGITYPFVSVGRYVRSGLTGDSVALAFYTAINYRQSCDVPATELSATA